ncbi:MAG TPA: sigma 54-interacting transcriptional regulator [Bryobacteraceae bacterium]|nr:sigma 54-interacting transcriptional regulator [Bryobacteraceae bacterium]
MLENSTETLPRSFVSHLATKWQRPEVLEAIFDQLSDALFLYDRSLRIVGVNQAAERLFGMSADQMIGNHCQDVFHCVTCEPTCGMIQALGEAATLPSGTVNLRTENGLERMVVIRTVQIFGETGALEGVVATVKDITEEAQPARRQIIAESQAMREVLAFVRRVAVSEASSILIEGENGTGKDLIAKTLHYQSLRQAEPFLAINCAAIPDTLLESELFGYEKGAFTDARAQKRGLFELADKGTLCLDEIGEIPLSLQAKLLRVLEEQCFRRLGGLLDIHVDLRIIAATNKNLREAVKEGAFRQDLYYRLNVIQLIVPPLRERPQDILPLARFFVQHYNDKFKRQVEGVSPEAESLLLAHDWPGNVRELRNAIERAMILEDTSHIRPQSLPIAVRGTGSSFVNVTGSAPAPFTGEQMSLVEQERRLLVQALEKTGGNQTQAARLLSITRDTLRYKMKKFNLR